MHGVVFQKNPWKPDPRDTRFTKVAFGAPALPTFPKTLARHRRPVKNQGNSLSCTAQASTLASEYQEGVSLSAEFQWKETCRQLGTYVPDGADYRTALAVHCKVGALQQEKSPFRFPIDDSQTIGNWSNWPDYPREEIEQYRKASYVQIPRVGDNFDSVRSALLRGKEQNQIVIACTRWFREWSVPVIPSADLYTGFVGYHCHTWIDFDTIDGVEYLVGQNSWGRSVGDEGFQYWPRDTVNKELSQWGCAALVFVDLTAEQIANARKETPLGILQRAIIELWWRLSIIYGKIAGLA